jgi:hypothetical protein
VNEYTFIGSGLTVDNPTDHFQDNLKGLWHLRFKMPHGCMRVAMTTHRGLWLPNSGLEVALLTGFMGIFLPLQP